MPRLSEAQLADRANGMGSTDVVEVCDLAPWQGAGPWRVWNDKLGIVKPEPPTPEQEWGHTQELVIGAWYIANVDHAPLQSHLSTFHPSNPFLWATLDMIGPDRIVEVKNVGGFMCRAWDPTDPDGVPHYVRAQVQIGMACACRSECHVVASLAGRPPELWTVRYDAALADMLIKRGLDFWSSVQAHRADPGCSGEPAIDASDACREYLRHKYPKDERLMLEPDLSTMLRLGEIGRERALLAERVKADTARIKEVDSHLLTAIGPHKGYECDEFKMTWKADKNGVRRSRFTPRGGSDE